MAQLTDNYNFLSPNGFKLTIESPKFDNFGYFVVKANLPSVNLPEVTSKYNNFQSFVPGDTVTYESIDIEFMIDEDMNSYKEVFAWIKENAESDIPLKNDITLHILSSHNNVTSEIKFVNAFPVSLSSIDFSSQIASVDYVKGTATFRYDYFTIVK
jgi:hypothetical protein